MTRTNLMSVSKITDSDRWVLFKRNKALVMDKEGNVKIIADRKEDLYFIRKPEEHERAVSNVKDGELANLWHMRQGHMNMKAVQDLFSKGLATGIKKMSASETSSCDVCHRGKLAAKPFKDREERSTKPLEIVHSDVCGPMTVSSDKNAKYFLTFIDDYSR